MCIERRNTKMITVTEQLGMYRNLTESTYLATCLQRVDKPNIRGILLNFIFLNSLLNS